MSGTQTVRLEEGKYEFDRDEHGLMTAARRNGEPWLKGLDAYAHSKVLHAALNEIARLRNGLEHIAGSCEGRAAEVARAALSAEGPA